MQSFENAKVALSQASLLTHPRSDIPTEIWTDASDKCAGAVLVQKVRDQHGKQLRLNLNLKTHLRKVLVQVHQDAIGLNGATKWLGLTLLLSLSRCNRRSLKTHSLQQ